MFDQSRRATTEGRGEALRENVHPAGGQYGRLLMRELLHRVNNEFAAAVGLISRTTSCAVGTEAKRALGVVAECIHAQARLNRALQMPDSEDVIDAAEYFSELCAALVEARLASTGIKLTLVAGALHLESGICWTVGMIVTELVTNASRHAIGPSGGNILVELTTAGTSIECRVSDDGRSQTPSRPGQGLKLIEGLTECLKGSFVQRFEPGGSTSVLFFKPDATPRKPV